MRVYEQLLMLPILYCLVALPILLSYVLSGPGSEQPGPHAGSQGEKG